MANIVNKERLDDLFGIESDHESFFEDVEVDEIEIEDVEGFEDVDVEDIEYEEFEDEDEDVEDTQIATVPDTGVTTVPDERISKYEGGDAIDSEIGVLMDDIQGILAAAKFLCDTSPDSEAITAASNMCNSATGLVRELNKGILQRKRLEHQERLEDKKIKARMDLAKFKAAHQKKITMGSNSSINIQNNMVDPSTGEVAFSQEQIIKELLKQNEDVDKTIDMEKN